jgi:hypothetical protein
VIVLRMSEAEQLRYRPATKGLLAWLHSDGVLLIPEDLHAVDGDDDAFMRELARAMTEPLGPDDGRGCFL